MGWSERTAPLGLRADLLTRQKFARLAEDLVAPWQEP
jgi:hypothetical protein